VLPLLLWWFVGVGRGGSCSGLRRLVYTLYLAIPSLGNVGSLLLLLFFIYAIVGVYLFGEIMVRHEPHTSSKSLSWTCHRRGECRLLVLYCLLFPRSVWTLVLTADCCCLLLLLWLCSCCWAGALSLWLVSVWHGMQQGNDDTTIGAHANFHSFPEALLLLFRMSTGEGWEGVMFDCSDPDLGGFGMAPLYFVSFVVIAQFVMVNLFIMIIVEDFEAADRRDKNMTPADIAAFKEVWRQFDPEGLKFIRATDVMPFMQQLPPPLGLTKSSHFRDFMRRMAAMRLRSWGGFVHFTELLVALHRVAFGSTVPHSVIEMMASHPDRVQVGGCGVTVRATLLATSHAQITAWRTQCVVAWLASLWCSVVTGPHFIVSPRRRDAP